MIDSITTENSYTETTRVGWGQKIGESIKNIGTGLLMFVLATGLLFWNEGRAVNRAQTLSQGRDQVVSVAADGVKPENDQKLVHLSAQATTTQTLKDPVLNLSVPALKLSRTVEMYQWVETAKSEEQKNVGGSTDVTTTYTYTTEWKEELIDSTTFKKPENRVNPAALPLKSVEFVASPITVGAFTLDQTVFAGFAADEELKLLPTMMGVYQPASGSAQVLRQPPHFEDKYIYFSADYTTPKVGDLRISYTQIPSQIVSVIAQQSQNTLRPFTLNDDSISLIDKGNQSSDQMFKTAEDSNALLTWIVRGLGIAICMTGIYLLLSWIEALADVIPFVSSILGFGTRLIAAVIGGSWGLIIIGIAWLWYRPLMSLGIFALVFGIWIIIKSKIKPMISTQSSPQLAPFKQAVQDDNTIT